MNGQAIVEEVVGVYRVIKLHALRRTPGVAFDVMTPDFVPRVDAVDRVIHEAGALSPGSVAGVERPWYMHPHQDDHLMVLAGIRYVDLYAPRMGRVLSFVVRPDHVLKEGSLICDAPCLLAWDQGVFHRIRSDDATGSRSVNLATHHPGFDIDTNFNIYDLDLPSGTHRLLRKGSEDQASD